MWGWTQSLEGLELPLTCHLGPSLPAGSGPAQREARRLCTVVTGLWLSKTDGWVLLKICNSPAFCPFLEQGQFKDLLLKCAWIMSTEMFSSGFASSSERPQGFPSQVHTTVLQALFLEWRLCSGTPLAKSRPNQEPRHDLLGKTRDLNTTMRRKKSLQQLDQALRTCHFLKIRRHSNLLLIANIYEGSLYAKSFVLNPH